MKYLFNYNKFIIKEGLDETKKIFSSKKGFDNLLKNDDELLTRIIKIDPTSNLKKDSTGKYSKWLINLYLKNDEYLLSILKRDDMEDDYKITDILKSFDLNKNKLSDKDINKYSLESLENALEEFSSKIVSSSEKEINEDVSKNNIKIFSDLEKWKIIITNNLSASCKYGEGTKWCTAKPGNTYFSNYKKDGDLYILLDKTDNYKPKFQFHFESSQFMDVKDQQIDLLDFFEHNIDVYDKFYPTIKSEIDRGQPLGKEITKYLPTKYFDLYLEYALPKIKKDLLKLQKSSFSEDLDIETLNSFLNKDFIKKGKYTDWIIMLLLRDSYINYIFKVVTKENIKLVNDNPHEFDNIMKYNTLQKFITAIDMFHNRKTNTKYLTDNDINLNDIKNMKLQLKEDIERGRLVVKNYNNEWLTVCAVNEKVFKRYGGRWFSSDVIIMLNCNDKFKPEYFIQNKKVKSNYQTQIYDKSQKNIEGSEFFKNILYYDTIFPDVKSKLDMKTNLTTPELLHIPDKYKDEYLSYVKSELLDFLRNTDFIDYDNEEHKKFVGFSDFEWYNKRDDIVFEVDLETFCEEADISYYAVLELSDIYTSTRDWYSSNYEEYEDFVKSCYCDETQKLLNEILILRGYDADVSDEDSFYKNIANKLEISLETPHEKKIDMMADDSNDRIQNETKNFPLYFDYNYPYVSIEKSINSIINNNLFDVDTIEQMIFKLNLDEYYNEDRVSDYYYGNYDQDYINSLVIKILEDEIKYIKEHPEEYVDDELDSEEDEEGYDESDLISDN